MCISSLSLLVENLLYDLFMRSWVSSGSLIILVATAFTVLKEMGGDGPSSKVASLAAVSASSLPGMSMWAGIHWMVTWPWIVFRLSSTLVVSVEFIESAWVRLWLSVHISFLSALLVANNPYSVECLAVVLLLL